MNEFNLNNSDAFYSTQNNIKPNTPLLMNLPSTLLTDKTIQIAVKKKEKRKDVHQNPFFAYKTPVESIFNNKCDSVSVETLHP